MPRQSPALERATHGRCGLARSLGALSDPWSFLILREAFRGRRTFTEFRDELGIATDILSARLHTLVDYGILRRVPYHLPGTRTRDAYEPTPAGIELKIALTALLQWGEAHTPAPGPRFTAVSTVAGSHVRAHLLDDTGRHVPAGEVLFFPSPSPHPHPTQDLPDATD